MAAILLQDAKMCALCNLVRHFIVLAASKPYRRINQYAAVYYSVKRAVVRPYANRGTNLPAEGAID
jgi:type I site-specific restriction-modification system R (restriction) subunit